MPDFKKIGLPSVGALFLGVGLLKLLQGDGWVVWFLLAFLFGGFSILGKKQDEGNEGNEA